MVDTDFTGALGCNQASNNPGLSLDGSVVVFESFCTDIVPPTMTSSGTQVYERRMSAVPSLPNPFPQLVSVNDDGTASGNADSFLCPGNNPPNCGASTNPGVTVNADGTAITFFSASNDIATAPAGHPPFSAGNVFVRYPDITGGGKTVNLTLNATGQNPDGVSRDPVISSDGGSVAFVSLADDLVTPDSNGATDVFESDLHNSFFLQPVAPVSEDAGSVTITVGRSGNLGTTDTVKVETGDGSIPSLPTLPPEITNPGNSNAMQPGDYTETSKTLTFGPNDIAKSFQVPITDDNVQEDPELFHVSLSSGSGAGSVPAPGPLADTYVVILDNDGPAQDWHAAVTQQPPASAEVGDTVTVKATISVDAGASNLDVTSLSSGAGTSGLDQVNFADSTPFTVNAGSTKEVTATARVTGAPGTAGIHLQVSADGTLGAVSATRTDDSDPIASTEAVTAALTGAPATVGLTDQIDYKLTLTNDSDTPAQVVVPAAGYDTPSGSTFANRTDGLATVPANGSTDYLLSVAVDNADSDGTSITQAPTGVTYAMSAVSLAARAVSVTPKTSVVQAPVVAVGPHTLTDVNGSTLDPGDAVDVSVKVTNTGAADTTATLADTLTDLHSPTNIKVDGAACGSCSSTATSVTAPLGVLAAAGSHVVTYTATVPASPGGNTTASSVSVSFSPATSGTSPTTADVASLTIGSNNLQDWDVAVTQQPPASAHVGDVVTVKATISVEAGADNLDVTALSSGAGTSGLDQVSFADSAPFTVNAGASKVITVTGRVAAAPGTGGIELQVSVDGTLGAASTTQTDTSAAITATEAATATLSGGPASVGTADQITYTLTVSNASDTAAQLTGLPVGLVAPAGTTQASRTDGTMTVAAHADSTWTLLVDVDDADSNGATITQTPGTVSYAMSAVGLGARSVSITPTSVSSSVAVPAFTSADHTTFTIGSAGTFSITTSGFVAPTLSKTGALPSNVTFHDNGDGTATLAGTPAAGSDGSYPLSVEATKGADHVDQSFTLTVTKAVQAITITSVPPAHPVIGDLYPIAASADSGLPVTFSIDAATTNSACTLVATVVHFNNTGTCVVDADQAGNGTFKTAPQVQQVLHVSSIATTLDLVSSGSPTVYGQPAQVTATISAPGGAPAGAVQFAIAGANLGAPVSTTAGSAVSPDLTDSVGNPLTPGAHIVSATFTPTDTTTYAGAQDALSQVVDKAASVLTLAVHAKTVTAAVDAAAPGAGDPSGTVTFTIDGTSVGGAALANGVATLHHAVKPGMIRHVGASYGGDTDFTGSSGSTARHDPSVSATLSSKHGKSIYGWYRSPVTVHFACTTHGAPLTNPCPHAVVLKHNGGGQSITRTVAASNGGMDTVAVSDVNIDRQGPSVHVTGVHSGKTYNGTPPKAHCAASDALSGVANCRITLTHKGAKTLFRATATDRAGNRRSVTGSYKTLAIAVEGASVTNGAVNVKLGHTYTFIVHSTKRPTYYDAAPAPTIPFVRDMDFLAAGHHRWALGVTMTHSLHHFKYWNVGVKIGKVMHVIRIRTR